MGGWEAPRQDRRRRIMIYSALSDSQFGGCGRLVLASVRLLSCREGSQEAWSAVALHMVGGGRSASVCRSRESRSVEYIERARKRSGERTLDSTVTDHCV